MADARSDAMEAMPAQKRPSVFRRAVGQTLVLLLIAGAAALITGWVHPPKTGGDARELTLTETRTTLANEKILWVDARPSNAFAEEHIPGAVWLAEEAWEDGLPGFVEAWTPDRPIVVYCGSSTCGASRSVARRLIRELNVGRVFYLRGGWDTWKAEAK